MAMIEIFRLEQLFLFFVMPISQILSSIFKIFL